MGSRGSGYGDDSNNRRRRREESAEPEEQQTPTATTAEPTLTDAERMQNAFYAKSKQEADNNLVTETQRVWPTLTDEEKIAVRSYSGKLAGELNRYLWDGTEPYGSGTTTGEFYGGDIMTPLDQMTSALNKSELQQDTMLERGMSKKHLLNFLGISDTAEIDDLIDSGAVRTHKGFMSTTSGDIPGSLAKGDNVLLKVFAPKGTKGMYINPVSKFGDGLFKVGHKKILGMSGKIVKIPQIEQDWDGKSHHAFGSEIETILQRGLDFKVMGKESKNGKLIVTVAVVSK